MSSRLRARPRCQPLFWRPSEGPGRGDTLKLSQLIHAHMLRHVCPRARVGGMRRQPGEFQFAPGSSRQMGDLEVQF